MKCKSKFIGTGHYKVTVKVDSVVKEFSIKIKPLQLAVGTRVVRGTGWIYGEQDGGAGNIGEVASMSGNTAYVVWPNGKKWDYLQGNNYLKIVD